MKDGPSSYPPSGSLSSSATASSFFLSAYWEESVLDAILLAGLRFVVGIDLLVETNRSQLVDRKRGKKKTGGGRGGLGAAGARAHPHEPSRHRHHRCVLC